ncbi:MAG: hypothetical protein WBV68_00115, partial [Exiguobacterium oxidotolerans]
SARNSCAVRGKRDPATYPVGSSSNGLRLARGKHGKKESSSPNILESFKALYFVYLQSNPIYSRTAFDKNASA